MKRLLAILLVVLMAMPFALLASAADAPPAEPKVTATSKWYVSFSGKAEATAGATPDAPLKTSGWNNGGNFETVTKDGGTCIVVGKAYYGNSSTYGATTSPVLFTAVEGTKDYTGTIDSDTDADANGFKDGQGTQTGMFMVASKATMTIAGDVIFDDITILDRTNVYGTESDVKCSTINVGATGKVVIGDNVKFAFSENDKEHAVMTTAATVEEGGYLYLHSAGFSSYAGKGTIVLDKALVTAGKVTKATFEGFEGKIVAQDGTDPFTAPDPGPIPTGDMTWVVAAVASIAVMGTAVVVSKKRA